MSNMYLVVGSGPTGVTCAQRLLQSGAEVTLLDVGQQCAPERMAVVQRLRDQVVAQWDPASRREVAAPPRPAAGRSAPVKLLFGSDFPYAREDAAGLSQHGTRCALSWARAGLSNVWGAAALPFRPQDMTDWPLRPDDLAPHYAAVERQIGLAGVRDDLEPLYPFYSPPDDALPTSVQADWVLARMADQARPLAAAGLHAGRSRLAVAAGQCRRCQLCLTGCVYDAIYSAAHTLRLLMAEPRFRYQPGVEVLRCHDDGQGATVHFVDRATGIPQTLHGKRAFVAAGALASARIVVASLGQAEAELSLAYHPYFLLPMLLGRNSPAVEGEPLHALAQGFMALNDTAVSRHTVHMQLYTYSPLFADRLAGMGLAGRLARPMLLGRLAAVQGFLHSHETTPIRMVVKTDTATGRGHTTLHGRLSDAARQTLARTAQRLAALTWRTGLLPLLPAMETGQPGDGNHIGAVFPMANAPQGWQSDLLGRVGAQARVHVVDAAVLPSLPASTITLAAMANARRVTTAALALD